jgi:hypothetical protein
MNSIGMQVKIRSAITLAPCSRSFGSGMEPSFAFSHPPKPDAGESCSPPAASRVETQAS